MPAADPVVSVIIPCYNGEHFIGDAIKSVLSQTYRELEVIVVDDGSSDGSGGMIDRFKSDSRLVYLVHDENRGIPAARNTGIRHSRGRYIAFLDQDDIWRQKKLAKQIRIMEEDTNNEIGLIFSDVEMIQSIGGRKKVWIERAPAGIGNKDRMDILRALFMRNFIPIVTATVRRECFDTLGLLDETILSGADDYEFCFRVVMKYRLAHIEEPLVARRYHGRNFTDVQKFYPDNLRILGKIIQEVPELAELKNRRLSGLNLKRGNRFLIEGKMEEARAAYKTSWRHERSNMKAFIGMLVSYGGPLGRALARGRFTRRTT
jgi:glycosyltransferase involved in cell wall biosynthesis